MMADSSLVRLMFLALDAELPRLPLVLAGGLSSFQSEFWERAF